MAGQALAGAVAGAFAGALEPLLVDATILAIARGLLTAAAPDERSRAFRRVDLAALERAREFLCANRTRIVRSDELERICGLSRFELSAQFKLRYGTSPYRFLLLRRLEHVRDRVVRGAALADLAGAAGFADQAHMTRAFKAAFGLTPGRVAALHFAEDPANDPQPPSHH